MESSVITKQTKSYTLVPTVKKALVIHDIFPHNLFSQIITRDHISITL